MNNELPNAPEITFNGLARYEFPIGDFRAAIQTDFSYKDDMFRDANNNIQGVTESLLVAKCPFVSNISR